MIAGTLPPSDLETYQIHIPWRSNGVLADPRRFFDFAAGVRPFRRAADALSASSATRASEDAGSAACRRGLASGSGWDSLSPRNTVAAGGLRVQGPLLIWTAFRTTAVSAPGNDLPLARSCARSPSLAAALARRAPGAAPARAGTGLVATPALPGRPRLIFTVRTATPVALSQLQPRPDTRRAGARYLCLALSRPGGSGELRLCLGGRRHSQRRIGQVVVNAAGRPTKKSSVRATVKRPSPNKLVVVPGARPTPGLAPRRYSWRALESARLRTRPGTAPRPCRPSGGFAFRLRPVRAVGCTGGSAGLVTNGPRDAKVVALTFDDGPSEYTARLPPGAARKGRPRRPSSRSARRCRAAKRRCARSSPKATRSATTR